MRNGATQGLFYLPTWLYSFKWKKTLLVTSEIKLNELPKASFKSLPEGRLLTPMDEVGPMCEVGPSILLNSRECSPLGLMKGLTFPLGNKVYNWGLISPLEANFTPRGKRILLKTALRHPASAATR
jgi:hypothetical protein